MSHDDDGTPPSRNAQQDSLLLLVRNDTIAICVTTHGEGDARSETFALTMEQVISQVLLKLDGWPRRVGTTLFYDSKQGWITWLEKENALFAYLHGTVGRVLWSKAPATVTKGELFERLKQVAMKYKAIEEYPHFPPRAEHYYSHPDIKAGDGTALNKLISFFAPATEIDGDLIRAFFATVFWGGDGGKRPMFGITSVDGPGVGKTTLVEAAARLTGGCFLAQAE